MKKTSKKTSGMSTKEIIRHHLRNNRGREIPLSEIREVYGRSSSAISNAIKELKLRGEINDERRPLKHGRYTVIWLAGDHISKFYYHPDEVKTEERDTDVFPTEEEYNLTNTNEVIYYLLSPQYDHTQFLEEISSLKLTAMEFALNYIQPLLYETGIKWESSELTIGQEHLITSRIEKIVYEFLPQSSPEEVKGTILLCPVEGEEHILNLLLLELLLSDQYKIINLGRSLPIQSLIQFLMELEEGIDWIFISITIPVLAGTLNRQIHAIHEALGDTPSIAIGGQGLASHTHIPQVEHIIRSDEELRQFLGYLRGEKL